MKIFVESMNSRFPALKARIARSPEIKGRKTQNESVCRTIASKWKVDCNLCSRLFKNRKVLKTHWKSYHWSDCPTVQRKQKGCPVKGCSFTKSNKALKEHAQQNHTVIQLLQAGIDVHKVRRLKMTRNDEIAVLKWLEEKKFVVVDGELPPPEKTKAKSKKTAASSKKKSAKNKREEEEAIERSKFS